MIAEKIKDCEIAYVKCYSKATETLDFIRFVDGLIPDMYYHNYTWLKKADAGLINSEIARKADFCMVHFHIPFDRNIIGELTHKPDVSVMGYYVFDTTQAFDAKNCHISKVDKAEMMDGLLYLDLGEDGADLGEDFCRRRVERRSKVYLAPGGVDSYLCYENGEVIGKCDLLIHNHTAKIEDFVVDKKHQRKGFGTAILKNIIDIAVKAGATTIYLATDEDDTPKQMYQKLGFVKAHECTEFLFRFNEV
ncbi:MAG: GNAT family N-acetyltransferase [Defluviitaleaceae bacterium]|nr:GNAT family N-acetyltransferase [Defluviitaleaceae bacterium]